MPQPFSMLGASNSRPTAVGESGYHLPMMPTLSGQDAWDSLVGYYPTRRMDSKLNPHTYQRPNNVRSTTMPNTKVALLRGNYATIKLAALDLSKSDLVRGFVEKCSAAELTPEVVLDKIVDAMRVHPHIAAEFQKCGMTKQAIGSGNGLQMPWMKPNTGITPAAPKPPAAAPQPPTQQSLLGKQALPPKPSIQARPTTPAPSPGVTPAGQENMFTAPFNAMRELTNGSPVAQHFFGFTRPDAQGSDVPNVLPANAKGPHLGQRIGSTVRTGLAGFGALPAAGVDTMRGLTGNGWGMDYSKMMARDLMAGVNTNMGTNIGHDVKARPAEIPPDMYIGPDEGRQFFGNSRNYGTGETSLSATHARGKQMLMESQRPDAEGGNMLGRTYNAAMYPLMEGAEPLLATMAGARVPGLSTVAKPLSGASPLIPLGAGATQLVSETMDSPAVAENQRQEFTQGMRASDQAMQEQAAATKQQGGVDIASLPQYQAAQELVQNDPEQAKGFFNQVWDTAKSWVTGDGKNEVNSVMQNGTLTPEGQQKSLAALTAEGYDWNQAGEIISKMDGWDQLGLWGGLGLAGIGLVHAMSGGGGLASLIMTLLGLGTAGFTAGKAGLLDQGSQDLTQGLTTGAMQATGNGPKPTNIPGLKQMLPGVIDNVPDAALSTLLKQLPSLSPDSARQLDQAAGHGSWGNSVLGFLGDTTGYRQRQMQEQLGLNPQQQDRVLKLWSQLRG